MKEEILSRFLKFISFDTQSNEDIENYPSTEGQKVFADYLAKELSKFKIIKDVNINKYGYLTANLPSNIKDNSKIKKIGLLVHLDTSPDFIADHVNARIIINYNGEDILLDDEKILSPKSFKELNEYLGKTIITTDGKSLLSADDKAGIAEIFGMIDFFENNPDIEHHHIKIAFTADEEIGRGIEFFDVNAFDCDFAYTIDGGGLGEIDTENFNAANAKIKIYGKNIHPGYAKDKMINAAWIASKIINELPENEVPEKTSNKEGFFYVKDIIANTQKAKLKIIIRDFDLENFELRKKNLREIVLKNQKEFSCKIELDIVNKYFNVYKEIPKYVFNRVYDACKKSGVIVKANVCRGGTDGSKLTQKGLPSVNIFTGGHNFHGPYEFICLESMIKTTEVIINIVREN
jgi:tripeptide aminopeptidase